MKFIIGIVVVIASVAGGYVAAHGKLLALWQPFELIIIGGAAFGAFLIANPGHVVKQVFKDIPTLLKPSPYNKKLHMDT